MNQKINQIHYSGWQVSGLTILRIMIGWHFLYEGLVKLYTPWSAEAYLQGAVGPFKSIFTGIAQHDGLLNLVNILNEWGLVLIGLALFAGLFAKAGKIAGLILLLFYYVAYPPFASLGVNPHVEGSYWIVNKNLIEMAALFVLLMFPSSHVTGLDRYIFAKRKTKISEASQKEPVQIPA